MKGANVGESTGDSEIGAKVGLNEKSIDSSVLKSPPVPRSTPSNPTE